MASDFQRPSSMMESVPALAQRRAVAPPGRKERADSSEGAMPVWRSRDAAAWRRALVMKALVVLCHRRVRRL